MIDGRPESPILIVGMAPGREELAQDRPFVGGSGRLLWAMAKRAGFSRTDCYIVNVIGEWPGKKDGNPTTEQLERYWEAFDDAVSRSAANVCLCLGGIAFDRLTGIISAERVSKRRTGIESWRGYLVAPAECVGRKRRVVRYEQYKTTTKLHKKGDPKAVKHTVVLAPNLPRATQWIIPTLHPAAVLRTGYRSLPAFAADVSRVRRALDGTLRTPDTTFGDTPCVGTPGDFVSIDIETLTAHGGDAIIRVGSSCERGTWSRE
jgi:uracil-DNA glycosylase family 4